MSETLVVHVNRDRPQAIETDAGQFEATGSFAVAVQNHGRPVHVHLHLDDALSSVAHLETGNHYVDGDSVTEIPVTVEGSRRPISGRLKLVTGYGARTEYVDVELVDAETTDEHVRVDETLSKPRARPESDDGPLAGDDPVVRNGPIAALGGFALLLAVGVASTVGGGTALVGALAVLVGVGVAAYLLVAR